MKRLCLITICLLALLPSGCITYQLTDDIYDVDGISVKLRGDKKGREWVSRGYEHPTIISPLRLARILAAVEIEISDGDEIVRTGILPYSLFQPVAVALAEALEAANPAQEIVVVAVLKERRLGLFHKKQLTSFIVYAKDKELSIHLSRVNWEVPKGKEDKLPTPRIGDQVMSFRVVPVRGMRRQGAQAIAARWRDPAFAKTATMSKPGGDGVRRRTILMDDRLPVGERDGQLTPEQLEGLSSEQVEKLQRLQDQRENGEITEDQYLRARDDLLLDSF